ncbi:glycoside hydrolase family 36 N-terminal domain-containing protein [Streptomyces caelestis]|uniref:glycoside hydrolase family 36 N-terminal domain-containing protein n=1 Tax=Streptomyces caelestis TaxID=36816 RepID=UPI001E4AEBA7
MDRPQPGRRPFEDPADGTLDLDTAGAMRYAHAGVQVRFPDGVRDLEPHPAGEEVPPHEDGTELVLRFTDRHYPLTLEAHYRLRAGIDLIERHLVLRHTGTPTDRTITIVRADSATWVLPRLGEYRLSQVRGQWCAETRPGLPLRALEPAARYRDTVTGVVHHGAILLTHGPHPDLAADDHASTLVHLIREPA